MISAATDQLARAQQYLGAFPGAVERAMVRALNHALAAAREQAITVITERYAIKASDLRVAMSIQPAKHDKLGVVLKVRSGSMPMHYFPHAPTQPGTGGPGKPALTATVLRGSTKTVKGAFVAKLGVKPRIVTRTGGVTATGKSELKVLYTTPIGVMLGVESVQASVEAAALETLDKRLTNEIDRELERVAV